MKNSLLRIISLILVVLLAFSSVAILSSCDCGGGGDKETTTNEGDGTSTTEKPGIFDEPIKVDSVATAILAAIQNGSIEIALKETEETTPIFNAPAEIVAKFFSNVADGKYVLQVKPNVNGENLFDGGLYISPEEIIAVLTPFIETAYGVKFDNFFGNLSTSDLAAAIDAMITGGAIEGEEGALTPVKDITALIAGLKDDFAKLGTILEKYVDLIGTELDKIPATTKEEQITVDGKTVNTTVTTYTITNETIITLVNNLLNAVKNDAELKALLAPYYDVISTYAFAVRNEKVESEIGGANEMYSENATDEAEAEEEFALPTLDEIFNMIPTLTADVIPAEIAINVSVWESNETKALVKLALDGGFTFEVTEEIYNKETEEYEEKTYTTGCDMDFTVVIGETSLDLDFVFTPVTSLYTPEEIVEQTIVVKLDATYDDQGNEEITLTLGTPAKDYFTMSLVTEVTDNSFGVKYDIVVKDIYIRDVSEDNDFDVYATAEIKETFDDETGAFDSTLKVNSYYVEQNTNNKTTVVDVNGSFKNVVETSTDEMEKGKMTLNVTSKYVDEEAVSVSFEMPYEIHADGNFKFDVTSNIFGTEYEATLKNEVEKENKGVISISLAMIDAGEEIFALSAKLAYEIKENGDFEFTFTYFDNKDFTENENSFTVSLGLAVAENTEEKEQGTISVIFSQNGMNYKGFFTYTHDKKTGEFSLQAKLMMDSAEASETVFDVTLSGNFLLDENGFVLKLGKLTISGEEAPSPFVIDLTITVKVGDTMPEFPTYTNIFDLNGETLGSLIEEIMANLPSFGGDSEGENIPKNELL